MSGFLYELSYLMHCKHFAGVFSLPFLLQEISFFLFYEKKNFKCELQYIKFLMS